MLIAIIACTKGGKLGQLTGDVYTVTGNATSKQLVPAIDTISTGTFTGRYDVQARNLSYTITWDSLWANSKKDTMTGIQFFAPAQPATNGPLIKKVSYTSTSLRGTTTQGFAGNTQLTDEQYSRLLEGAVYYIITTAKFPNGIIRGQLEAKKQD